MCKCVFFPEVLGRGHIVQHREHGQGPAQQFVDVGTGVDDGDDDNEFVRTQATRGTEETEDGIDDKDEQEKRHEYAHRDHAFNERDGVQGVLYVGDDGVDAEGEDDGKADGP